jgi:hypothetical protein
VEHDIDVGRLHGFVAGLHHEELLSVGRHIVIASPIVIEGFVEQLGDARRHRFQSAHDLGFALEALSSPSGMRLEPMPASSGKTDSKRWHLVADGRLAWGAALVALALAGVLGWRMSAVDDARSSRPRAYLFIPPPPNRLIATAAISPDGRQIAYISADRERWGGNNELWVRPLASANAVKIAGASGAYSLFWSPDSQWLAFFTPGKLKKVRPPTGAVTELCAAPGTSRGTWSAKG